MNDKKKNKTFGSNKGKKPKGLQFWKKKKKIQGYTKYILQTFITLAMEDKHVIESITRKWM